MPIYAYRCTDCGFENEFLQKISEPPMTVCPSCGKEAFRKKLTAAGFQLKGSGWYATDFRNNGAKPAATSDAKAKDDSKATTPADGKSESKTEPSSEPAATPAKSAATA